MGKIAGFSISENRIKGVFLERRRGKYFLKRTVEGIPPTEISGEIYISYLYIDLIVETVEIPLTKDKNTREILLKRQLSEREGITASPLLITYKEIGIVENRVTYKIYAIPSEIYEKNPNIPSHIKKNLSIFTLPQFALAAISYQLFPDKTVFHIYADEYSLLMVVSKGENILYIRSLPLPSFIENQEVLKDFLKENVGMTCAFVIQRQGIKPDLLLLSGKAAEEDLAQELKESTHSAIAVPLVPDIFEGVSATTFHLFLTSFGSVLVKEDYDFSPSQEKEKRKINRFLKKGIIFVTLLLITVLIAVVYRVYTIKEKMKEMEELYSVVISRTEKVVEDPFLEEPLFSYYLNYVNLLSEIRTKNPLNFLTEVKDLLKHSQAKRYALLRKGNNFNLILQIEKRFSGLTEMALFRERIYVELKKLSKRGIAYKIDREIKNLEENTLKMEISVEGNLP